MRRFLLIALFLPTVSYAAFAATGDQTIKIKSYKFSNPDLTIPAGATVTWVNKDEAPHTIVEKNKAWRSAALDTDDKYAHTFTEPGTYSYFCTLHPQMVGTITVTAK